ncbi:MAG: TetR/AcrR family transcriptional regulator [Oscillospiraceae bacterium]|nr:TetR/AcrR family transcriptional regulator [Oscillospiraceae bacterium]
MSNDKYHHGNLKNALIEAGIEIINESGEEYLSLRKVAARCGVSSAAPYSHFANKEEMILAMQDYVTDRFMTHLKKSVESCSEPYSDEAVLKLGEGYILFFLENPQYFSFLFSQPCMKVQLSLCEDQNGNFPPYDFFRQMVIHYEEAKGNSLSDDELEIAIIKLWSTVHGISAIAAMKNVRWNKRWEDQIRYLL